MNEKKNSNEFLVNFCNISFFVPKFYITMSSIPRFVPKHGFADPFRDYKIIMLLTLSSFMTSLTAIQVNFLNKSPK